SDSTPPAIGIVRRSNALASAGRAPLSAPIHTATRPDQSKRDGRSPPRVAAVAWRKRCRASSALASRALAKSTTGKRKTLPFEQDGVARLAGLDRAGALERGIVARADDGRVLHGVEGVLA